MTMVLTLHTRNKTEFVDITDRIAQVVHSTDVSEGLCMVFVPHTTAAVTINESADPSVQADILSVLNRIVPRDADYRHLEGNSPAHVQATLVGASELLVVENRRLVLGTWQGVFFCEFDGPRTRRVHVKILPAG